VTTALLERELADWDGRSKASIESIYERAKIRRGFVAAVIALAVRVEFEVGATWLLKRHLEDGGRLVPAQSDRLFELLGALEAWEARLHVLQSLPHLRIREAHVPAVQRLARDGIASERPFVRAWAYSGFCELANEYPEFTAEAERLLERARGDEAASVRARVRRIEKARAKRRRSE
jgi:hypothetical protein